VIISHYHGDHINGLLKADKSLAFPNAEILVPANEHQFYMDDGNMSRATQGRVEDVFKNVRRVISGEVLQAPFAPTNGTKTSFPACWRSERRATRPDTRRMSCRPARARSMSRPTYTHAPFLFARNPGWHAYYDQDPVMAEATRRKVYDMLVREKMLVQGFHYPFPSDGHVEKTATGYREIPMPWTR
jgi:hypothetical protein